VGPKISPALFEDCDLELGQVTGAVLDRLNRPPLPRVGIPIANIPGGSNIALPNSPLSA
jgi:hypothetical protein